VGRIPRARPLHICGLRGAFGISIRIRRAMQRSLFKYIARGGVAFEVGVIPE
jgi:hypothetical protein